MSHNLNPTTTLRYLLFLITAFCCSFTNSAKACCIDRGRWVDVYPKDKYITANSCFLIDFENWKFNLGKSKQVFKAVTTHGKSYELVKLQSNFRGKNGQLLLKANTLFKQGDTLSLSICLPNGDSLVGDMKYFAENIANKKWIVSFIVDTIAPTWLQDSLTYQTYNNTNSSINDFGITLIPKTTDTFNKKKSKATLLSPYMEITFANQRLICTPFNGKYEIYSSICGNNFNFSPNKYYSIILRPIDASGNMSSKHLKFELKKVKGRIRGIKSTPLFFSNEIPQENPNEPIVEKNIEKIEIMLDSLAKPSMNAVAYLHQQLKAGLPFLNSDTINAKFMVRLTLEKDGTVSETKVIDIKKILSENDYKMFYLRIKFLMEMLKNQCTWSPGYKYNKPVRSIYKFDLRFP